MDRRTIGAAFATGSNNFDLIRLLAALLVLASHAYILTGHPENEPFAPLLGHTTDGGGLAVVTFFVLSGFLIARSAEIHPAAAYLRARARRIYPALVVAILIQTFALGLLATRLPPAAYLAHPATWDALWHALLFSPRLGLPGVFEQNPFPLAVNGSLWTLRIEILCYAGLLLLSRAGLMRRPWVLLAAATGFVSMALAMRQSDPRLIAIAECLLHFTIGMAAWCYRDTLPRRLWLAIAGIAAVSASIGTAVAPYLWHLVLPYLVLFTGLAPPVGAGLIRRLGDVSYGTYLYAFPIEQALMAWWGPGASPHLLIAASMPAALLCGALSRRFIEQPALRWRPA